MTSLDPTLTKESEKTTSVVYGVYDSSAQPFAVRMNDFVIDRQKVNIEEKSYFFHLLAVMLDAGIPIMRALKILSKKTSNERFARIVNTIAYDVERGKRASQSMTKFPDVFKDSEVGVMRSGEAIGNLSSLLFRLAEQTQRAHELYLRVRGALIYPATVMVALFVSGGIVVTVVIPKLDEFFTSANFEMPFLTVMVLKFGRFFVDFSWLVVVALILVSLLFSYYASTQNGRRRVDRWVLNIPWLKDVIRKYNVAQFVQLLSLLVDAGVPIHEAIEITGGALSNTLYKDFARVLRHDVERGEKVAASLAKAPFLFPETVVSMIEVGENTGQLGLISEKLAKHYEKEVQHSLDNFTTILEPLVIVFVGVAVGILAVALLAPIFSLSTLVS
ncbi:MAG: type IV pilus assembly protein PilC [Oceanicoccus sp.]|jgi:type IV pilus assembly protein PilC